jgi:predicted transcriptional regulator
MESRARAERAVVLRGRRRTWDEIATELGYSTRAAARNAVHQYLERTAPVDSATARVYMLAELDHRTRQLGDAMDAAAAAKDADGMALLSRELRGNRDQAAKMVGAYQPERSEVDVQVSSVVQLTERVQAIARRVDDERADDERVRAERAALRMPMVEGEVISETQ